MSENEKGTRRRRYKIFLCSQLHEENSRRRRDYSMNPLIPIFCIMVAITIGTASAQPYQEIHLSVNGMEVPIGTGQVQVLKIPSGQVYSTIHIEEPETISCTLQNCVTSVQQDATFGGFVAKISGTKTNETSEIQLVNSQSSVTYTIVMEVEPKQIVAQDPTSPFGMQIPEIPNFVLIGIVGVVGIVGLLLWNKSRGVGKIVSI